MKQADLNKRLSDILRETAKCARWKFSRGFLFRATDLLFFEILVNGQAKDFRLSYCLNYKMLEFDDLFWKIVKLEENAKKPLSFRAAGVWTAPTIGVYDGVEHVDGWELGSLTSSVQGIVSNCVSQAGKLETEVKGLEDNLLVVERLHKELLQSSPKSVKNIWRERLLTAILKRDWVNASNIVSDRVANRDFGGFQNAAGETFYEMASDYIQCVQGLDGTNLL